MEYSFCRCIYDKDVLIVQINYVFHIIVLYLQCKQWKRIVNAEEVVCVYPIILNILLKLRFCNNKFQLQQKYVQLL